MPAPRLGTGGGRESPRVGVTVVFLLPEGWRWCGKWGSRVQVPRPMSLYHVPYAGLTAHVPVPCPCTTSHFLVPCPTFRSHIPLPGPTSHIWVLQPPRDPKPSPQHRRERGRRGPIPSAPLPPGSPKPEQGAGDVGRGTPHAAAGTFAGPVGAPGPKGLGMPWGRRGAVGTLGLPAPSPMAPQPHGSPAPQPQDPAGSRASDTPKSSPKSFPGPGAASGSSRHRNGAGVPRLQPPVAPGGN